MAQKACNWHDVILVQKSRGPIHINEDGLWKILVQESDITVNQTHVENVSFHSIKIFLQSALKEDGGHQVSIGYGRWYLMFEISLLNILNFEYFKYFFILNSSYS